MIIEEQILVDAPIAEVWALIDRMESVIPCVPGTIYEGQEGEDHLVAVRVRVGVISASFKGRMRFAEKDAANYRAVIEGSGRDTGGKGSAKANIIGQLEPTGANQTRMHAIVDLSMTGRIAQFGGPVVADIAKQLVAQFGSNLQERVLSTSSATAPAGQMNDAQPEASAKSGARTTQPTAEIDLGQLAFARYKPFVLGGLAVLIAAGVGAYVYFKP